MDHDEQYNGEQVRVENEQEEQDEREGRGRGGGRAWRKMVRARADRFRTMSPLVPRMLSSLLRMFSMR